MVMEHAGKINVYIYKPHTHTHTRAHVSVSSVVDITVVSWVFESKYFLSTCLILHCYFVVQVFFNSHNHTPVNHRCKLLTVVITLCDSEQLAGDM